jgi:hypothetical protein
MSSPEAILLKAKFPDIKKMKHKELIEEVKMWRNLWSWIPAEVKYYVSRTGQQTGITMRNYKRYLGILLDTHWDLKDLELGVYDKIFDQTAGEYYFERKIIRVGAGSILDVQWIAEREPESKITGMPSFPPEGEEQITEQTQDGGAVGSSEEEPSSSNQ